jgi:hypothetical protein
MQRAMADISQRAKPLAPFKLPGDCTPHFSLDGVTRRSCPIAGFTPSRTWQTLLTFLLDTAISLAPIPSGVISTRPILLTLSVSDSKSEIIEWISQFLPSRISVISDQLASISDLTEFAIATTQLAENLRHLSALLSCFSHDFASSIHDVLRESLDISNRIPQIPHFLLQTASDTLSHHSLLHFFYIAGFLDSPGTLKTFFAATASLFQSILTSSKDKTEAFVNSYSAFETLFSLFPPGLRRALSSCFSGTVFKGEAEPFAAAVCPFLIDGKSDFLPFLCAGADHSPFGIRLTSMIEHRMPRRFNPDLVLRMHQAATRFPFHYRRVLDAALRRVIGANQRLLAICLLDTIDSQFAENQPKLIDSQFAENPSKLLDSLVIMDDFAMIESLYIPRLLRRLGSNSAVLDGVLVRGFGKRFAPEKVFRMRSILDDYRDGFNVATRFDNSPGFGFVVLWRLHWTVADFAIVYPEQVQSELLRFEMFYRRSVRGRAIKWDPTLSSVTLECEGLVVDCDAVLGTFLLAVADGALSIEEAASKTGLSRGDVEAICQALKSRKTGDGISLEIANQIIKLVVTQNDGAVKLPPVGATTRPVEAPVEKVAAFMSQDGQIDAAVIRVLKNKPDLTAADIHAGCLGMLRVAVSIDALQQRLERLAERRYLTLDAQQRYKFIP